MDALMAILQDFGIGPDLLLLGVVFLVIVFLVMGVYALFTGSDKVERRMQGEMAGASATAGGKAGGSSALRYGGQGGAVTGLLQSISRKTAPKDERQRSSVRKRLIRAGYYHPGAVGVYFGARIVLAIVVPILALIAAPLLFPAMEPRTLLMVAGGGLLLGYFIPWLWLDHCIQQRAESIRDGFPDALDLLLICVEAGLSLSAALNRVSDEIGRAYPVLGEQLRLVSLEMQAGMGRETALRNLSDRVKLEEVNSFVTMLIQSQELGTSISQTLRVHADEMRLKRQQRAEEKANALPTKMAIPLALFFLPCLMIVIMTPVIIRMMGVFGG